MICFLIIAQGLPDGSVVKYLPANAGDLGLIPGSGRPPGEGNDNPFQHSYLENPWTEEPSWLQSIGSQESDTTEWLSHFTSGGFAIERPTSEFWRCFHWSGDLRMDN